MSPFAGTTRDVIEVHLDLGGYPVTLLDTAGIRETEDPVEREGVRRASEQAASADLVLWVVDATAIEAQAALAGEQAKRVPLGSAFWIVVNKIDLLGRDETARIEIGVRSRINHSFTIGRTAAGLDESGYALGRFAQDYFPSEPALVTRERQPGT